MVKAPKNLRRQSAPPVDARAGEAFPIVGVGASAGGLEAFTELLAHLPVDTGMAFVLVQHLDPRHESALTKLLARATRMRVQEITQDLRVKANCVYVIPPNTTLGIAGGVLKLEPREPTRAPLRSIDSFLEALAAERQERAIGVILSGTANDGTVGLEAIKAEGGITFAQDDSARCSSMPRSAVAAGCVDLVLSPAAIALELARIARHPYVAGQSFQVMTRQPAASASRAEEDRSEATEHQDDATPLPSGGSGSGDGALEAVDEAGSPVAADAVGMAFKKVLLLLRDHSGVDFSLYKSPTIQRRIARRLVLNKHDDLQAYADFLRGNTAELEALYSDVLVSVTSFFRNPESFEVLKSKVFPDLLQQRGPDPVRVWTLGCSTGQEAYSIAMAFAECAENAPRRRKLQLFATDLNGALVAKARQGLYAKTIVDDVSPERLQRFFVEEEEGYRVVKSLRESVVFARQNLVDDPPFSRIDLISCRNLLIYFEPALQKKAFPLFHYALKPDGFLFLGASESIGGFTDLFEPADRKHKIYSRKAAPHTGIGLPARKMRAEPAQRRPTPPLPRSPLLGGAEPPKLEGDQDAQSEADRILLSRFSPPSVVVDDRLQILQFRGATDAYLIAPTGRATFDLLKMAREGLMLPLRATIDQARKSKRIARKGGVPINDRGVPRQVNLTVVPLKNSRDRCFLVVFQGIDAAEAGAVPDNAVARKGPAPGRKSHAKADEWQALLKEREAELGELRDYVQGVQEEHDAASEELQSANEEVQSANEELQSLNEELETSKEELESSNEELTTVNEEMAYRNVELHQANNDLINLQTSTRLAIVLLGRDLSIRRFSEQAARHFRLLPGDIGRPIGNLRHNLRIEDLDHLIAEVIASLREYEREVMDQEGHWWSLRIRPYLTSERQVDGAVLVLLDIDSQKRDASAIVEARDYAEAIIRTVRDPLLVLDSDLVVQRANASFYGRFKLDPMQVEGRSIYAIDDGCWNIPELRRLLKDILPGKTTFENFEISQSFNAIGPRQLMLNARTLVSADGGAARILLGMEDVAEREQGREALRFAERRQRRVLDSVPQKLFTATADGDLDYFNPAWMEYTGLSSEKLLGSGWVQVVHPDDAPENLRLWRLSVQSGEPFLFAHRLRQSGGEYRWHLTHAQPVRDDTGKVSMWAGSNSDLHEVKEAERRKDEFLAMLAHELRGPLAPLSNALEIMRKADAKDEVSQRAGALAIKQMRHMSRLIDDLLNISRISRGRMELRRMAVEVAALAQDAIDNCREAVDAAGHQLVVEFPAEPLYVDGDPVRLAQIFGNLLANACKYTPPGGTIRLCVERRVSAARFTVEDNGIGIAPEMLSRIFETFEQVDHSMACAQGGLGIGLSLVRSLVELHGGTVEAQSDGLGRGARFAVLLPALPPAGPHAMALPSEPSTRERSGRRILVVDDNRDTALSMAMLLQLEGHHCAVAHDGVEALTVGYELRPDVVLLDLGLPRQNGFEVAVQIRNQSWGKNVTLIAVTGWGQVEDRRKSKAAGFDDHLLKPVDHEELTRILGTQLRPGSLQ